MMLMLHNLLLKADRNSSPQMQQRNQNFIKEEPYGKTKKKKAPASSPSGRLTKVIKQQNPVSKP